MTEREVINYVARERRARLRADGWCINGAHHGGATHGVLCLACRLKHRGSPRVKHANASSAR